MSSRVTRSASKGGTWQPITGFVRGHPRVIRPVGPSRQWLRLSTAIHRGADGLQHAHPDPGTPSSYRGGATCGVNQPVRSGPASAIGSGKR